MEKTDQVAVYVSEFESKDWMLFQQHYDPISILIRNGIFELKNAAVTMHFDREGILQVVQRADYLYSRKHSALSPQL